MQLKHNDDLCFLMETRTVKPRNQLPNILRPSMPRRLARIDYFKIARTPAIPPILVVTIKSVTYVMYIEKMGDRANAILAVKWSYLLLIFCTSFFISLFVYYTV
jgi:hypothetical protein